MGKVIGSNFLFRHVVAENLSQFLVTDNKGLGILRFCD